MCKLRFNFLLWIVSKQDAVLFSDSPIVPPNKSCSWCVKSVFDDNEKQSFENSLVWTGPKTDKKQTKENKNDLLSFGSYFHQMNSITVATKCFCFAVLRTEQTSFPREVH